MKVIFILSDSFRQDHLGFYGNPRIHTPNLDRLAAGANVFEQMYAGSFPTGPNRRDILLSKGHAPGHAFNPWINIREDETPLPRLLSDGGVHTMMITDVANGVVRGRNMFAGFNAYRVNRGQEGDAYWSDASVPEELPVPPELIRYRPAHYQQVRVNRAHRRHEDDYFAPGTFRMACEWLERNWKRDRFFLWVETFDPHEPWDPPEWYVHRYDPGYRGRVIECPPYGFYRKLGITRREVRHLQARYCGECTMVDTAVGRLLATLEKLDLLEEVAICFTSDHGIYAGYAGDAGCVGKPWVVNDNRGFLIAGDGRLTSPTWLPLRTGTMRIPLVIKLPGQRRPRRIQRIAQPWDLAPTILRLFGLKPPSDYQGRSLLPALGRRRLPPRLHAFNGCLHRQTQLRQVMTRRWIYSFWPSGQARPFLIDLKNDPTQTKNVAASHPDLCRRLHAALARWDPGGMEGSDNP
ncbi:MAG: hypothetical protein AMJ81_11715 [Phycisphaerae bacterium SM23_33]|nr:MAG: hypothetical protein AMJ81_11715 [Phycisphaerae bacterium SM23_33]